MKLPYTAVLTLFLNSAVSAKKTGDDHMIRNLLAKVDALHDAKIAQDAKMAVYDAKIANLEALLMGTPRVPQGKKNLRRRGLREDDANVDFAAILMDFSTTEEKTEDMIAQLGVASVLKTLIIEMDPVFNCLKYDKDSQTCTLGSDDTNNVDIIAEDDIDVRAVEGGDITIDAEEGDVDIFAGDAVGGGNITISALSANNDDDLGNVNIDADEGVDIDTNDVTLNAAGVDIDTDDFTLNAGFVDIDAVGVDINADDVINLGAGNVNIGAGLLDIDSSKVDIATDDFTLNAAGVNLGAGNVNVGVAGNVLVGVAGNVNVGAGLVDIDAGFVDIDASSGVALQAGPGSDVAVITNGGDFTVDGATVVP